MSRYPQNPYTRQSKFQHRYPLQSSTSCQSLLGPSLSICPPKKYSTNNWLDYRSSHLQLSQKVMYRMWANYHKMQENNRKESDGQHCGESCLLNNLCKNNPFSRVQLIDSRQNFNLYENPELHWTNEKNRMFLKEPTMYKSYSETISNYRELKNKIAQEKDRYNQSNAMKKTMKDTFGNISEDKNQSSQRLRQYLPFQDKKPSKKISDAQIDQSIQKNRLSYIHLIESQRYLKKNQSNRTFGNRNSFKEIPSKISHQGKQFFFVQLGMNQN